MNIKNSYQEVSYEELLKAYKIVAKIVTKYGNGYLPIFERLHAEIEKFDEMEKKKILASKVASE